MAVVDSPAHLLSLKVMRVSRPEVTSAWQPFFSSSSSFSAHASASIVSLQGQVPLPGHPKTLRDLTHASDLLSLPASFGSIQLGQTFSSCLCINNEAPFSVDSISIRVEMQTVTSKVLLFQTPEPAGRSLAPGDTLETLVHHEIKEQGQHVLACTVKYRLPPNVRSIPGATEDPHDPGVQTFRKFYKFIVTNPLGVKIKVHPVRSPTALLTPTEREKLFVEVHVQNITQETMHFERLAFEPTEEWHVEDPNILNDDESTFSDAVALMNPQDIRQYIFILTPTSISSARPPAVPAPGSIFPLGRLNIVWRSAYGEPGRLLTSMLTRRIPLINPTTPAPTAAATAQQHPPYQQHPHYASALPPHLKRERERISAPVPSRPQSPAPALGPQSRPGTPPIRRPQSPALHASQAQSQPLAHSQPVQQQQGVPTPIPLPPNLSAHITLRDPIPQTIHVEEPFKLGFILHVSTTSSSSFQSPLKKLLFAIQHVLPSTQLPPPSAPTAPQTPSGPKAQARTFTGTATGHSTPRTILSPTSTIVANPHPQTHPYAQSHSDAAASRASFSVLSSGFSTPTAASSSRGVGGGTTTAGSASGAFNYTLAHQKLLTASPRETIDFYRELDVTEDGGEGIIYPPPYSLTGTATSPVNKPDTLPLGASSFPLPPLLLSPVHIPPGPSAASTTATTVPAPTPTSTGASMAPASPRSSIDSVSSSDSTHPLRTPTSTAPAPPSTLYASHEFELTYIPLCTGFAIVGGLRVLYLGEAEEEEDSNNIPTNENVIEFVGGGEGEGEHTITTKTGAKKRIAQIVREYDVVAETWVSS